MNIVVIGGVERSTSSMRRLCSAEGHHLTHHDGTSSQRANLALRSAIGRADLAIIVTGINSHGSVLLARALARDSGVPSLICRRFGVSQLRRLLDALAAGHDPSPVAQDRPRPSPRSTFLGMGAPEGHDVLEAVRCASLFATG
ncbi:MAG: DUF2325 domain-containing protein [Polyangiaceae bacterium]